MFLRGKSTYPSCNFWHPPVCLNYKSESGCKHGDKCRFRHVEADGQPSKKSKKSGVKDQLLHWRSLYNWVVCLKILIRENLFYGKKEYWDQIAPSSSPRARGTRYKFGKERVHREASFKSVKLSSAIRALPDLRRGTQDETPHQWRCTRSVAWDSAEKRHLAQTYGHRATPAPTSESPEEREFVVDSGASMHMLSKEDFSSGEMETLRRSGTPQRWVTASGEVQTSEEAQVYVHDLELFVTVEILDDTPAVQSLGKLCEELGKNQWVGQR